MQKKALLTASITSFVALVMFMLYSIVEKVFAKEVIASKVRTLHVEPLFTLDSTRFVYNAITPTVLIFFDSNCEHCRYELAEISKSQASLENVSVILMSAESLSSIKAVGNEFGINNSANIQFVKVNRDDLFENYGSLSTPHIFIYGVDRKLIKEFKGETKIEALIKYLP